MDKKLSEVQNIVNDKQCKTNHLLDVFKFISALLIVSAHTLWSYKFESIGHYFYQEWFFRFCVPLFLIASGLFFHNMEKVKQKKYIKRILLLYLLSTLLYLPKMIELYHDELNELFGKLIWGYYHLWYLSGLLLALIISYGLNKVLSFNSHKKFYLFLTIALLLFGIFFDEYYLIFDNQVLYFIGDMLKYVGTTRNGIFMAFPLFTIGRFIIFYKDKLTKVKIWWHIALVLVFSVLSFLEALLLYHKVGVYVSADLTIFNWVPALFLILITFYFKFEFLHGISSFLRKSASIVYIIHPLFMIILEDVWLTPWVKFAIVLTCSLCISIILILVTNGIKKFRKIKNPLTVP